MSREKGFGLIEIIVGAAIIVMVILGSGVAIRYYLSVGLEQTERIQASYLVEEGLEAMRYLRDQGYTANIAALAVDTSYQLATSSSGWTATTTSQLIENKFTRTVRLQAVYRLDTGKDMVSASSSAPKTLDANVKKVTVKVSWTSGSTTASTTAATYYTNIFNN